MPANYSAFATQAVVKRKLWFHLVFITFVALMVGYFSVPASAYPGGISGFSGKSASTCTSCHSTGAAPTVTWSGPTSINSGSTATFTLTVGGGGNGGLDVAASTGAFTAGTGTQVMNGEITHSSATTTHSWTFSWTAPTVTTSTVATIWGAAIDGYSGGTGATQQTITVLPPPPPTPTMTVSPTTLAFSYTQGGTTPAAKTFAVASSGSAFSYTLGTSGGTWLSASGAGSTPGTVSVSVNPSGLAAGTYNGSVTVTSSGASNSPQSVPVTLTVAAAPPPPTPTMALSPTSLAFSYTQGGTTPAAKTVSVSTSGTAFSYTLSTGSSTWLSATGAGSTPGTVSVSVNPSGLAAGTYNGSVTVTSTGASNSPQSVPVTLTVAAAPPPPTPTMALSPTSLAFSYTQGGTTPAAKTVSVSTSGTAFSYTLSTGGGTWLSASGAGSTPGTVSVAVNPSGLAAGTYNGSVMVTSSGASNSPQSVPVTLTVAAAPPPTTPSLTMTPTSLAFSYTMGGTAPAAKSLSIGSSGSAVTYSLAASGGSWLTVTGGGSTPGTASVSVNPAGMNAGTYNGSISITASGASNSPQTVPVTLTVTSSTPTPTPTGSTLTVYPNRLVFFADGTDTPSPKTLSVRSSGSASTFTASVYGGSWVSVSPTGGTTPGTLTVSAYPAGLAAGTYTCVVQIKSGRLTQNIHVILVVGSSRTGGGEDDHTDSQVRPFTFEPGAQGTSAAYWRSGLGASSSTSDPTNQGLALIKRTSAPTTAIAGAIVKGAAGSQLTSLGYDLRSDSECSAQAPQFIVVTADNVTHTAGCNAGSSQVLSVKGWKRVSFNPLAQLSPPVQPGATVKTVALVMDRISVNGYAVLDNLNINGRYIGKQ